MSRMWFLKISRSYLWIFSIFSPPEGLPLHSWVLGKKGALTPTTPSDGPESTAIEVEDIPALLRDVARFAEAVEKLKDVVMAEGTVLTVKGFFWGRGGVLQPCTKCESLQRVNFKAPIKVPALRVLWGHAQLTCLRTCGLSWFGFECLGVALLWIMTWRLLVFQRSVRVEPVMTSILWLLEQGAYFLSRGSLQTGTILLWVFCFVLFCYLSSLLSFFWCKIGVHKLPSNLQY